MVRINSDRLRGFYDEQTDGWTDICDSRVAFATENVITNEMNNEIVTHLYYIICNDDYKMCVTVSSQQ